MLGWKELDVETLSGLVEESEADIEGYSMKKGERGLERGS